MLRAIVPLACVAILVLGLTFPARLSGDVKEAKPKRLAEQAKKFEYPSGAQIWNFDSRNAFQSVRGTPDGLDVVDVWYRKVLSIQPSDGTGVSSRTTLVDQGTRGYEAPVVLYVNDQKLKDGDPPERVPQTPTVRSYIVKEAEYTLVVVATRNKEDKATQISVTYLPASSE